MADKPKFLSQEGLLYFWSQLKSLLANKVDKETGKGLSTNDFTNAYMNKLDGINASSTAPLADGTATVGVSGDYARADHVHPSNIGYGTCSSSANSTNLTVTINGFELHDNTTVIIYFAERVKANATLNINSSGAKPIYVSGSQIQDGDIQGRDTVVFQYDGSHFNLLSIDSENHTIRGVIKFSENGNEYGLQLSNSRSTHSSFLKAGTENWATGIPLVTTSVFGLMSAADKVKLDGIDNDIDTAIQDALSQITGFDFVIVQELPATGEKGVIYLVAHSHDVNDGYDEYIWINNGYEKLGHADVDLSGYMEISDIITNAQIDTILGS